MRATRGVVLGAGLLLAAAPARPAGGAAVVERRVAVMGTTLAVTVEAADRRGGLAASEAAIGAVEAAEARLSTWREDTELARLNRAPAGVPFPLSPALAADLRDALACARATGGAFDPTVGPLVAAWDLRGRGRVPAKDELARAVAATGCAGLEVHGTTAIRRRPGLKIEEGGWGKGAALRDALAALDRAAGETGAANRIGATNRIGASGALGALLDLGGQVAVWSAAGARTARTVEIADPRRRGRPVVALALDRGSVATSGNSERSIVVGGRRYGHLLDPRTGRPAPDFGSLTVWAADPFAADCLSKLYVLGPDRALAWAAAHPEVGVLVLAPEAGGRIVARASRGLAGRLTALVPELRLEEEGAR